MSSREPNQSFEAARRQHLIDATIEALADVGFKAASLHQIAQRADVSTGLFAHYFGDKDGLLEATLRFMAARLVRATRQRLRAATCARERLYAVPDSALADQEFERRTSAVWLAFWGQITHSVRYQRIQFIYQRRMLSNLRHDLRALVPPPCVALYATMIASMIDGVWIRSHASPQGGDAAQARALVRALIDRLVSDAGEGAPPPQPSYGPMSIHHVVEASRIEIVNSATSDVVAAFMPARATEVDTALRHARLGAIAWQRMAAAERARALRRCAAAIRDAAPELARLGALCIGRAVRQTIDVEVPRAADAFDRAALRASRPASSRVVLGNGVYGYLAHEPFGVMAAFSHWSLPLLDPCRQAAAALSDGNAIVVQPAMEAPLSAERLRALVERAGLPPGTLTIVTGDAETTRLLAQKIPCLGQPKAAPPEKAAAIVLDDADLDATAHTLLRGGRPWAPTPDLSETILFVQRRVMKAFSARLAVHARTITAGDPLASETEIGTVLPPVRERHLSILLDDATGDGATLLTGARKNDRLRLPTILAGCKTSMAIVRQNLFAPVVALVVFEDDEEIADILRSQHPDAAVALFATDCARAHRIARRLPATFCCLADSVVTHDDIASFWAWIDEEDRRRPHSRPQRILARDSRLSDV